MKIFAITFFSLVLSSLSVWSQAFQFTEDFQSTNAGQRPSSGVYTQGGTHGIIQVVDDNQSASWKDPFGPAGNHSLMILDNGSGIPRASWTQGSAGIPTMTAGHIEFDFYTDSGGTENPLVFFFFGQSNSSGGVDTNQRVFNLQLNGSELRIQDGSTTYRAVDYNIARGQAYDIRVEFFDKKYEVYVKTFEAVEYTKVHYLSGGNEISTFQYLDPDFDISFVQFTTANSGGTHPAFYIDNVAITAIPEGAFVAGLAGLLVLGYGLYRRRNQRIP